MVGVGSHQDSVLGEEHAGSANPELEREPLAEVLDGPARCGRLNGGAREIEQQVELCLAPVGRSEEHTSELQSLMRISYAVFCLKKKTTHVDKQTTRNITQQ